MLRQVGGRYCDLNNSSLNGGHKVCERCEICLGDIVNGYCVSCGLRAGDYLPDDSKEGDGDGEDDDALVRILIN